MMSKSSPSRDASAQTPAMVAAPDRPASLGAKIRELTDELMLVFVIVMFIKLFIVELYKIPTGSMTPTLLDGRLGRRRPGRPPRPRLPREARKSPR
jgi:hypothetical protein